MIIEDKGLLQLNKYIPNLLKIELYKNRNFDCCPHCGSIHFIRNGYYNGIQRYKCHGCKRTFSKTTNSLWYYSKKQSNDWVRFMELFLEKQSLRKCSETMKINLSTAFFWRHKIMNALKSKLSTQKNLYTETSIKSSNKLKKVLINKQNKYRRKVTLNNTEVDSINPSSLKGDIFLTYAYLQENSYNSTINFKIDFYRSEKRIYVAAAKGKDDSMIVTPICRNYVFADEFKKKIYGKIDEKSYIILYDADHLYHITKNHNKRLSRKTCKDEIRIKSFQENIRKWFCPLHGIATKYLENYLCYFILYNLDKAVRTLELTYSLIKKLDFIKTCNIKLMELSL